MRMPSSPHAKEAQNVKPDDRVRVPSRETGPRPSSVVIRRFRQKRAAQAIGPAVKAALERAARDWRAHARQAEPLRRNHVATKKNRAAKSAIG
jgi:hypothetical protein